MEGGGFGAVASCSSVNILEEFILEIKFHCCKYSSTAALFVEGFVRCDVNLVNRSQHGLLLLKDMLASSLLVVLYVFRLLASAVVAIVVLLEE